MASQFTWADRLPLHSLRLDGLGHCGPYSMSFMLESRALNRSSFDTTIDIETNLMYWINYERMMFIYKTKNDFYMSATDESSWQIEYWEVFLKHGREILASQIGTPDVWYNDNHIYRLAGPFVPEVRPTPDPTLIAIPDLIARLKQGFPSDADADAYIRDYLDRWYGKPTATTATWMTKTVALDGVPALYMDSDFATEQTVDSMVLVKPVTDGNYGWTPYLNNRYWAYLYDSTKALDLVRMSLDHGWPVTYDMGVHAETIIGYRWVYNRYMYAVADSLSGTIEWMETVVLQGELNLLTFASDAIPGAIPARTPEFKTLKAKAEKLTPPR